MTSTDVVLVSYGNNRLKPIGSVDLVCSTEKHTNVLLTFTVIDVKAKPILGLQGCQKLQLIKYIVNISLEFKTKVIESSKVVFEGLGNFPGELYHIKVKVSSVINAHRWVPLSLH